MLRPLLSVLTIALLATTLNGQQPAAPAAAPDPIRTLVGRLELEKYKATIKGLTQFGDRRQGTERNRKAVDWIEAQLKSYGCTNTERIKYTYTTAPRNPNAGGPRPTPDPNAIPVAQGGGRPRGVRAPTGVNIDPMKQPDAKLRALNTEPTTDGPREEVYCTKIGATRPDEMYIIGAHMDGHGWGEAANEKYATDYPSNVGEHMTNTDSTAFMDLVPSISLRENERGIHTGSGWNPHWHQPTDVFATFTDKDFRLGLNAAQTTLSGVAQLTGAKLK